MNSLIKILILIFISGCLPEKKVDRVTAKLATDLEQVNFGQNLVGETKTIKLKLLHADGSVKIKNLKASTFKEGQVFNYYGGVFPGEGGSCSTYLKKGEDCSIVLSFSTTKAGSWKYDFLVSYNDGVEDRSLKLKLLATAGDLAELEIYSNSNDFGVKELNSKTSKIIFVKNKGEFDAKNVTANLNGSVELKFKGGQYPGEGGNCSKIIKANSECKMVMEFYPRTANSFLSTISLDYKNPYEVQNASFTVSGVGASIAARLFVQDINEVDFEKTTITSHKTRTIKIKNDGILPAQNLSFSFTQNVFSQTSTTCSTSLGVNETCDLTVQFSPVSNIDYSGNLQIHYHNGKASTQTNLNLLGKGANPALLSFDVTSPFDFGIAAINKKKYQIINVVNNGESDASSISVDSLNAPFAVEANSCPNSLKPTLSCSLILSALPNSTSLETENLNLDYHNGLTTTSISLTLTVTGKNLAILEFDKPFLDFEPQMINEVSSKTITLTNIGTLSTTIMPFTFSGAFSLNVLSTCTALGTLNPNESCTFVVDASSPTSQFYYQNLLVSYFDGEVVKEANAGLRAPFYEYASLAFNPGNPDNLSDLNYFFARTAPNIDYFNSLYLSLNSSSILMANAKIISIEMNNTNFNSIPNINLPGANEFNTLPECVDYVLGFERDDELCQASFAFNQPTNGDYTTTVTVRYYNDLSQTNEVTQTFDITGRVENLGHLSIANVYDYENVAVNGTFAKNILLENTGTNDITSLTYTALAVGNGFSVTNDTCGGNIAIGATCLLEVTFAPTATRYYEKNFKIKFNNGGFQKNLETVLMGNGKLPALLKLSKETYDFGPTLINSTKTFIFTVTNNGEITSTGFALSSISEPYRLISNTCNTQLSASYTCQFEISYTPLIAGQSDNEVLQVSYHNGVSTQIIELNLSGLGEVEPATHKGWNEIYARGNTFHVNGSTIFDKKVKLAWEEMEPAPGYTIQGYRVYRSLTSKTYDLNNFLAEVDANTFEYIDTDNSLISNYTYYYTVKPIILGTSARTLENFSEVKVIIPPDNMVFVHRWIANKIACTSLGASIEMTNNFRCSYNGPSATSGKFDLGYHLLVDRFELGVDGTNKPGQLPQSSSQISAWNTCQNSTNEIVLDGNLSTPLKKRLLTRKEHLLVSTWPETLSNTDINNLEESAPGAGNCNGSSSSLTVTGANDLCASRFGAEDMVGNSWEWVSDRLFNGIGVTNDNEKLDVNNKDLDGLSQATLLTNSFKNMPCFNMVLGIALDYNFGACPTGSDDLLSSANFTPSVDEFFQNDHYFQAGSGLRMAAVGGSFSQYPGRYSLVWLSTINTGSRCAVKVP